MVKKALATWSLILLASAYGFAAPQENLEAPKNALEILQEVHNIMQLDNIRSEQVMTVVREDATIRQYRLRIMTRNGDKAFAEIIEPKKFQGRQFLRSGDNVWAFFPDRGYYQGRAERRTKTVIRVSGRETFMGGDFSNNDVLRLSLVADYVPEIIDDLPDQYVLKLTGKDLSLAYATARLWVRKVDFQPIRMEFYTISDELIKSVFYQDYRDFGDGLIRPGMLEVKSAVLPKSKTFLEIIYLKRGVTNPASRFQRSSLGS